MTSLFELVVPDVRQHPAFKILRSFPGSEPARLMMDAAFASFEDSDGNFIEQFQSTGFDARVFELYLHAYFSTLDGSVRRPRQRPDFLVSRSGLTVAVEATTSNPT